MRAFTLALMVLAIGPSISAQVSADPGLVPIVGTILRSDATPIVSASVRHAGSDAVALSDAYGMFRIVVPRGLQRLSVRAMGFLPLDTMINSAADAKELQIRMRPAVTQLDTVTVVASMTGKPARYANTARFDTFYERRATAVGGTFFAREDIERAGRSDVTDLLRTIAGVKVERRGGQTPRVLFARCGSSDARSPLEPPRPADSPYAPETSATVQVFVDGVKVYEPFQTLAQLNEGDIEAMEVYRGVAQLPAEARGNGCAAIFLWTRFTPGSVLRPGRSP